jgi:hypothetical protein
MTRSYKPLPGADFTESFLMRVKLLDWPNEIVFHVWAPQDQAFYKIVTFMRTGTRRLEVDESGLPLGNIYLTYEEEYEYWRDKIAAYADQGHDTKRDPYCIEFDSHLFANRKRNTRRDRNMGMLVVCREVTVTRDDSYTGVRPNAYRIPSRRDTTH